MTDRKKNWQRARQPEQKAERVEAILDAAGVLLDEYGLDGTGLNAIARQAGLSKPNLYVYFESREAILLRLLLNEASVWTKSFKRRLDQISKHGDIDAIVLNSHAPPTILRNDSPTDRHWLQIQLEGVKCNRDGVGSRVRVVAGDLVQVAEVHSGRGYQSHYGMRLHFGLADQEHVDRIEVHWSGGEKEVFSGVDADQLVVLKEGSAKPQ